MLKYTGRLLKFNYQAYKFGFKGLYRNTFKGETLLLTFCIILLFVLHIL